MRPGTKTIARSGYVATSPKTPRVTQWSGVPAALTGVINSPLPTPGLTFRLAAPAFRAKGSTASIGVIIEARANQLQFTEQGNRFNGAFNLFIVAADADGRVKDREFGTLLMKLLPDTHADVQEYGARLATKLELKPGRYQLRVGALERSTTLRGAVYLDLDVPDYSKGPLSVSGIALISDREARAPTAAPDDRWKRFVGAPPTAQREFSRDDGLRKYVEVYDNSKKRGAIELTTMVRDQSGRIAFTSTQTNEPAKEKSPIYRFITPIPLEDLEPGQYLLTAEARSSALDGRPVVREIPFTVR
jgi:hypothetical protein